VAYEPLALKYRPRTFSDLVGQEAVTATLENAIASGRIANAFIFSGSRGVGKTSAARILAAALNCRPIEKGHPELAAEMEAAIRRGEDMDVIEIDGASNRGIDEIRAIRENVGYAPSRGRFKIYIIDEVHMLTIQAFNALLKTLEEPPPHVKFIFATTEPQAVPETILSRCQRYEFRRISRGDIVERLAHICREEGISCEAGVLEEIAGKAEGGLRDSISLLDQAVSFAGTELTLEDLDRVLGRVDSELLEAILVHAAAGETGPLLDALDAVFETGRDAEDVLGQLVEILREAMVREARGEEGGGEGRRAPLVAAVRSSMSMDRLLFALRVCLNARREMKLIGQGRLQLELAFLKIARSGDLLPVRELLDRIAEGEEGGAPRTRAAPGPAPRRAAARPSGEPARRRWEPPAEAARPSRKEPGGEASGGAAAAPEEEPLRKITRSLSLERIRGEWIRMTELVRKRSSQVGAFLEGGRPETLTGTKLLVVLPADKTFAVSRLEGTAGKVVRDVFADHLGTPLEVVFRTAPKGEKGGTPAPRRTVYEDRDVRRILDNFEGSVMSVENEDQT